MGLVLGKMIQDYWRKKLLDGDFVKSDVRSGLSKSVLIEEKYLTYFYKLSAGNEMAAFTLLLTVFNILIRKYFQRGGLVSSRGNGLHSRQLLFYTIPQPGEETIKTFLLNIRKEVEAVVKHTDDQFPAILHLPEGNGVTFHLAYNDNADDIPADFVLQVARQVNGGLEFSVHYSRNFVDEQVAEHFVESMATWMKDLEKNLNQPVVAISLVTAAEQETLLHAFNATELKFENYGKTLLHELVEAQARRSPDAIAIVHGEKELTYREVNERANRLANFLRAQYQTDAGDLAGVKVSRNEQLIIAILAVLKTGAAYVPIDINYPEERVTYIQQDSNCKVIIDDQMLNNLEAEQQHYSGDNLSTGKQPHELAYIIYTSGTTGKPKGVMVSHHNAVALIYWAQAEFSAATLDTVYAATSHCFDLSVYEIFYSLSIGKKIRMLDSALEIGEYLKNDTKVLINTVPSSIRTLLEGQYDLRNVTVFNLAGEPFPVDLAQKLLPTGAEVRNLYGPSEDTTYSTCYRLSPSVIYDTIPIGKPIANTQAYILDDNLQLLPVGVMGKLYLSGDGITLGYLNREALTAERFIDNPFRPGNKMYDTGDLAKWRPDGNILFLGRKDQQVKLRGYRIELGEIEQVIQSFSDNILQAVVAVKKSKDGEVLAGYYTVSDVIEKESLRTFLASRLPAYMVPAHLVKINTIPLTVNGKINRDALPSLEELIAAKGAYTAPVDTLERALVNIWEQVLGVSPVGTTDHFFELGGHSLMIAQVINNIYKKLQQSISYKVFYTNPTIKDLKHALKHQQYVSIPVAVPADSYPVTPSQFRFWLLSQLDGGSEAYQISGAVELKGRVDQKLLIAAFDQVLDDYEILRTVFKKEEGKEVRQYILSKEALHFTVATADFSGSPSPVDEVNAYIQQQDRQTYDLTRAPLLRAALLQLNSDTYVFYLSMHHLIGDGWSLEVLTQKVLGYYAALLNGETIVPSQHPIQFKDYAVWLEKEKTTTRYQEAKAYWLKQFTGEIPVLQLPAYKLRPKVKTFRGEQFHHTYAKTLLARLKDFSRSGNVTLFTVLLAGVRLLLSKYSNQEDVVIGTPVAGREHPDLEDQLGLFINTLAIRNTVDKAADFMALLQQEAKQLMDAFEYQHYAFDALVAELNIGRDTSRSPLFDVMVVFHNQRGVLNRGGDSSVMQVAAYDTLQKNTSQFDLTLSFAEQDDHLSVEIKYNNDIYDRESMERLFLHYGNLLESLMDHPETPVGKVNYLSVAETEELVHGFNDTRLYSVADRTITDLFAEQARRTPDAVALVYEDRILSYRELDELSNQLARYLQNEGVDRDVLVPVCVDTPLDMIIGMLGVIKAGGAYVPVDAALPWQRISFILEDSGCKQLLTHTGLSDVFKALKDDVKMIYLDQLSETLNDYSTSPLKTQIYPDQLIYVIYTSGTTGMPKGVMIEHRNLLDYVHGLLAKVQIDASYSYGLMSTPAADLGYTVLYGALATGGQLHTFSKETLTNAAGLLSYFREHAIDFIKIVPSHWASICQNEEILLPQKGIIFGGERLTNEIIASIKHSGSSIRVYNHYGPTETTIGKLMHAVNLDKVYQQIPLGKVFSNAAVYILNTEQQLVPPGVIGELCIAGAGLARGYLKRPELTAAKFIAHPFKAGERLYRTGDLARWLPDGNVEFLGRLDDQVKIHGHRIELGEVESALLQQDGVSQVVVSAAEVKGDKALVAYIVMEQGLTPDKRRLREDLSKVLPAYMLPGYYVELENIPLTSNGKIDRKALPAVGAGDLIKEAYVAPRTTAEQLLAKIWQDVLGMEQVGATDNFFELGGHSLKAVRLINEVEQSGYKLKLKEVFECPVLADMAGRLGAAIHENITKAPEQEYYPVTSSQRRLWTLSQFEGGSVAYNMANVLEVNGVMDMVLLQGALDSLIARHESLRTVFKMDRSGMLGQYILPADTVRCLLGEYSTSREEEITSIIRQHITHQFDLSSFPLLKIGVIHTGEDRHLLLFNLHHIVGDGWSMEVLSRELITQYNHLKDGVRTNLLALPIQYKDYAYWLESAPQKERLSQSGEYWRKQLSGNLPVLELPATFPRPKLKTYNGLQITHVFSPEFLRRLQDFSGQHGATLFMSLMAGLNGLFYRYSGQTDILLGSPVAGREHASLENQIGLYLNTLAVRTRFEATDTYSDLLLRQKSILLEAYEHQDYPFDGLIEELSVRRDISRSALFDILVVMHNQRNIFLKEETIAGLSIAPYANVPRNRSHFDIGFSFLEAAEGLHTRIDYNPDIYDETFIRQLLGHLECFIEQGITHPEQNISRIDFITPAEKDTLLHTFNAPRLTYPSPDKTITDLFAEQARRTPDAVAVVYEDRILSYRELDELSNQLARYLQNEGVDRDVLVPVCVDTPLDMIIGMLGVIKAGGAYVPVDAALPWQRISFILEDSGCKQLLTHTGLSDVFKALKDDVKMIYLDQLSETLNDYSTSPLKTQIYPDQLIYVIYTSGTTGMPKGVMIEHRNLLDYVHGLLAKVQIDASYSYGLMSTPAADLGYTVLYGALATGGQLHTFSKETLTNAAGLLSYFREHAIDFIKIVPSHWASICQNEEILLPQKGIIFGGERLTNEIIASIKHSGSSIRVYNHYGPTETTIGKLMHTVDLDKVYQQIPLGKVFSNAGVYILNTEQQLVPPGVIGELCIAGAGLARGYLKRPELTAAKFIAHPFKAGERLYRTGDLARWLPDGNVEFLGRLDDQVKIHGHRIELGEVESALLQQDGVSQVVVSAAEVKGDKALVAYIVMEQGLRPDKRRLREDLSSVLPAYMLPGYYVELENIPLTSNGKVDRKALPAVGAGDLIKEVYVAPRTTAEQLLAEIWQDVLGMEQVGATDNFFELGGHSLKAVRLINEVEQSGYKLKLKEVFECPVLADMAGRLGAAIYENITKAPEQEYYPVTSSQRRLWTLSQFEGGSVAYNMTNVLEVEGVLDTTLLQGALDSLIARHESLRTVFKMDRSGILWQHILPGVKCALEMFTAFGNEEVLSIIRQHITHQFDLSSFPLLKIGVIHTSEDRHLLLFNLHHIVGDGWSMEILSRELITLYNHLKGGTTVGLPALSIQYKDYAYWLESAPQKEKLLQSKAYWHQQLSGNLPVLELPATFPRPKLKTYNGSQVTHVFSPEFLRRLQDFSGQHGATLFMSLMAGLNGLFYRYSGQTDILLGSPVAGRAHASLENQIGLYLNTLAIRTSFEATDTYENLLTRQKETLLDAYAHQDYPFDALVEELSVRRDISRSALFDILVVMHNQRNIFLKEETIAGLKIAPYINQVRNRSHFDISFSFSETADGLHTRVDYNTDIYDAAFIRRLLDHLEGFIEQGIAHPKQSIAQIDFVTAVEKEKLLHVFNATELDYPANKTIVDLLTEQAGRTPDAVAVVYEDRKLTYRELDERSNELANYLLSEYHIQPEDPIGIKLERTEWIVIAIAGVLKSGATYVPIDPAYPEERIAYIETDSVCRLTINASFLKKFLAAAQLSAEQPQVSIMPANMAYMIYTSGSTGKPKGVMIEHGNAVSFLYWSMKEFASTAFDIVYAATSHCFDLSVFEMFYPLSIGKKLRVISNGLAIPDYINEDQHILINTVPSVVANLLERNMSFSNVAAVNTAGELLPVHVADALRPYPTVFRNLYGPTETTTYSSCYPITKQENGALPVGKPIANTQFYVLSEGLALQPEGVTGEVYISGAGVTRGYLNRPELTAEKFIAHPFRAGERLYRTGDLARWLPDGNMDFVGRIDHQVKIHGHRIELGEIESTLLQQNGITHAVVVAGEEKGDKVLVAYVVTDNGFNLDKKQLREDLGKMLPSYMLPGYYVELESIPLTSNSKIDRKALPKVAAGDLVKEAYIAPQTVAEQVLAEIWQDVLSVEQVSVTDNFFELGGHSLKAVRLINETEKAGYSLKLKEVFEYPVLADMAGRLGVAIQENITKAPQLESYPVTSSQRRLWALSQFEGGSVAYNIANVLEAEGQLDTTFLQGALDLLVARHESLRTVFRMDNASVLRQHILPDARCLLEEFTAPGNEEIQSIIRQHTRHQFDMGNFPLLKVGVIHTGEDRHLLLFNLHHIIGDGWSMEVLSRELITQYNRLKDGVRNDLPALPIQYKDYAYWQESAPQKEKLLQSKAYWHQQLSGNLPVLELPATFPRPKLKTYNGAQLTHVFSPEFLHRLQDFSGQHGATLFMSLMAGLNGLFYRYSGQTDILLGSPVAGREYARLENQIGLYLNTLAVRTRFEATDTYRNLLTRQKETLLEAYEHQDYPFDGLVEELSVRRDISRSALFDILVVLHNQRDVFQKEDSISGLKIAPYKNVTRNRSHFDISFSFSETTDGLHTAVDYNTDIYDAVFIRRLLGHLEDFIEQSIAHPEQSIAQIDFVTPVEKEKLLSVFNANELNYPANKTIVDLLTEQARRTPEAVAVIYEDQKLTYRELDERSNELANYLLSEYDLKPEDPVAIKLERTAWMVIAIVGVLKSGAAYVPIDPAYPEERIAYMEADSACRLTITESFLKQFRAAAQLSAEQPQVSIMPANMAYMIYTSGSTGKPKGVMIEHGNAVSFLYWSMKEFKSTDFDILYAATSYCFDLSVFEMFYPLSIGKKIRVISSGLAIPDYINDDQQILINTVPSVVGNLLERAVSFKNVIAVNMAGEPIPVHLINAFKDSPIVLRNLYGPTESTTYSSCYRIRQQAYTSIPVGQPISNTQFYILSEGLALQPEGVTGEVYISGAGLARGYLNRRELTAEKFIAHPFRAGERLYKTGDLARWLPDGNVAFSGRIDHQVKIHGYRIELGEIESALLQQNGITHAVVVASEEKEDKVLVAYIVLENDIALDKKQLREDLSRVLPSYMLPGYYVVLESIPLTSNGKVDRKALPKVAVGDLMKETYVAPRTAEEQLLVKIWQDVLGVEQVSVTDNFFELGGHSLKAVRLINETEKAGYSLKLKEVFEFPELAGMASRLGTYYLQENITEVLGLECYPVTSSQRRLWALSQFEGGSVTYNIANVLEVEGVLETALLQGALDLLIARHESLRTVFKMDSEGVLWQYVLTEESVRCVLEEYSNSQTEEVLSIIRQHIHHQFNLGSFPLLKVGVIHTGEDRHLLLFNLHHIVGDGWSMEVLSRELMTLYNHLKDGTGAGLPALPIQYKDYASWLESAPQKEKLSQSKAYWHQQLSGNLPVLELPATFLRPKLKTYNGAQVTHDFSDGFLSRLQDFSRQHGATLFMSLMAGLNGLFYRYSGQTDMLLGSPVAGREHARLENQIGLYLNTLAVRTRFEATDTYKGLLTRQKETLLEAYEHQDYPFDRLVEELSVRRDISRSALFDILVVLHNQRDVFQKEDSISGLKIAPYKNVTRNRSHFDISFSFSETAEGLHVGVDYNTDIYDAAFIRSLLDHLERFIEQGIAHPEQSIAQIDFVTAVEKEKLLHAFNATELDFPANKTIVDLLTEQARRTPEAVAVIYEDKKLTYRELDERSNELANYLLSEYDVKPEDPVAIKLERTAWMVIAIVGVLKSGAAYVPIDPAYPEERIAYMEADSACRLTITESFLKQFRAAAQLSAEQPQVSIMPANMAYMIYTSGSTGKPKGVMIEHGNAVSFLYWSMKEFKSTDFDILYAATSYCFDLSVFEMFYPLIIGKKIRVISSGLAIPDYINEDQQILINTVPSVVGNLLERAVSFKNVIAVNMAGEPIPVHLINAFKDTPIVLRNLYGPTESTTYSSCYQIEQQSYTSIPVGQPISNTQFYILSEGLALQPEGVTGEVYISGAGLARGYLNRRELTAEKFIAHPFRAGERLYKTGDLARWLPDGNIAFSGRIDHQVKIHGYRIELGEIESALLQQNGITHAVVVASEEKEDKVLVAYIVLENDFALDKKQLREDLNRVLPSYMLPGYYVVLESIPLTSNGKVDRKALPKVDAGDLAKKTYVAPQTAEEYALVEAWQHIFGVERVGVTDNFLDLGGHSLQGIRLVGLIHKQFNVILDLKQVFLTPVLREQAVLIASASKRSFRAISRVPEAAYYAISPAQQRLWVLSQFEEASVSYNIPGYTVLDGAYDIVLFKLALKAVIERHEILRTVFVMDSSGVVCQRIMDTEALGFEIGYEDFRGEEEKAGAYIEADSYRLFDLEQGPLLRAALLHVSDDRYIFYYNLHHIISDGWSMGVLERDVMSYYKAFTSGTGANLPELPIQYKDYAAWQLNRLETGQYAEDRTYWLEKLSGDLPVLDLPSYKSRPKIKTYNGYRLSTQISSSLTGALNSYSREHGGSLFMGLLAVWNVLCHRYTSQKDIITGTPVAGREHSDLEDQIGFYVNTLALRNEVDPNDSFDAFFARIKDNTLESYEHQQYPFDHLVEDLGVKFDTGRNAIFDVMLVLQNAGEKRRDSTTVGDDSDRIADLGHGVAKFDLSVAFQETGDALAFSVNYNTDVYDRQMVERLIVHYKGLLAALLQNPGERLGAVDYLSAAEKEALITGSHAARTTYPEDKTVVELFTEQARLHPHSTAVIFEDQRMSYETLHAKSNQLAHHIRDQYHRRTGQVLTKDTLIAICLEKCPEMAIAIFAILKAGGAYVPIDPSYPQQRIDFILEDSGAVLVLSHRQLNEVLQLPAERVLYIDPEEELYLQEETADLPVYSAPADLAYIIYTSGTTGKPKGVMIEHRNLTNLVFVQKDRLGIDGQSNMLLYASLVFDASVWEVFGALALGAQLTIVPGHIRQDIELLKAYLNKTKPTTALLPPVLVAVMSPSGLQALDSVLLGGDVTAAKVMQEWSKGRDLINGYGPTETTVIACMHTFHDGDLNTNIGKPIANNSIFLLDAHLQPVPAGVTGELYIGGAGVARGYLNNDELTATRFMASPFVTETDKARGFTRFYRTGDLGKRLPDGSIEYMGRIDDQVKIRGHRIELKEIEAVLLSQEHISQCVIEAKVIGGEKVIVAYVVSDTALDKQLLHEALGKKLPAYMLPAYYVSLDRIPITSNGKVDRAKLPAVAEKDLLREQYVAPQTAAEQTLVKLWQEVLHFDQIGIMDDFFRLGGNSLKLSSLLNAIRKEFHIEMSIRDLFTALTIKEQGELVKNAKKSGYSEIHRVEERENYPISVAQRRLLLLNQMNGTSGAYNIPYSLVLHNMHDIGNFEKAVYAVVERHEILRTVFREDEHGQYMQWVLPAAEIGFAIDTFDFRDEVNKKEQVNGYLIKDFYQPFDLSKGPLIRAALLRIAEDQYIFYYNMHHIICDGWSTAVLSNDVMTFYSAFRENREPDLPALKFHYKDFAIWQLEQFRSAKFDSHKSYWQQQLHGEVPVLNLSFSKKRPRIKTYNGNSLQGEMPQDTAKALLELSIRTNTTLFMNLLCAYSLTLNKYSGQKDLLMGSPISGRVNADLKDQIGFYVNTLVYRVMIHPGETYQHMLSRVKNMVLENFEHQEYPFDLIVEDLDKGRDFSRNPLFDYMLQVNQADNAATGNEDVSTYHIDSTAKTAKSKFDITSTFNVHKDRIHYNVVYNTDLFGQKDIEALLSDLFNLLRLIVTDTTLTMNDYIDAIREKEELQEYNNFLDEVTKSIDGEF
ncbi:non-ribosomal peptide synthase/polyketide synthase [Chitinophaga sp. HK235]|uniref:non-ribosomal peptide synthase/polyketide synthase n=1 Tax=Chitinophaga sp. HK235 TaxID=2952571 RepID=UPI001BA7D18F|nr:non-ribosomal peptide synthase/polyketide synthase [Chitinophaga sp. HK235]